VRDEQAVVNNHLSLSSTQAVKELYADPPAAYLDPDVLSDEAKRAAEAFHIEGSSDNTRRTYHTALLYWGAWYALRYGRPLTAPVSVPTVLQFILDHLEHNPLEEPVEPSPFVPSSRTTQHLLPPAIDRVLVARAYKAKEGPWSRSTVMTRLAALSKAHDLFIANHIPPLKADANPLRDPGVRQLLSAVRRAYARRPPDHERRPPIAATRPVMEALLATCQEDLPGIRDRALLLFGFASGGRRRSEIVAATLENVRRDGEGGFVFELGKSKTNQSGMRRPENIKPIVGEAAVALEAWLNELFRAKITEGAIFRRIHNGNITEPLRDQAVWSIVRSRAKLVDPPLGKLTAHSLRSGFVTESGRQNIPIGEAMALTGHRSVQTFIGYYRSGEMSGSAAARLMEQKK
jgi:integrase